MPLSAESQHANSIEVMAPIDALPKAWRELVHEYGREIVLVLRDEFDDPDHAFMALEARRARRQADWLATDFVRPKSLADIIERAEQRQMR